MAKYSDATRHSFPAMGADCTMAARLVRRAPVKTSSPEESRSRSVRQRTQTFPSRMGRMSVVVLPVSTNRQFGNNPANHDADASQLVAAKASGLFCALPAEMKSPEMFKT